jgi:hypothetical protein
MQSFFINKKTLTWNLAECPQKYLDKDKIYTITIDFSGVLSDQIRNICYFLSKEFLDRNHIVIENLIFINITTYKFEMLEKELTLSSLRSFIVNGVEYKDKKDVTKKLIDDEFESVRKRWRGEWPPLGITNSNQITKVFIDDLKDTDLSNIIFLEVSGVTIEIDDFDQIIGKIKCIKISDSYVKIKYIKKYLNKDYLGYDKTRFFDIRDVDKNFELNDEVKHFVIDSDIFNMDRFYPYYNDNETYNTLIYYIGLIERYR